MEDGIIWLGNIFPTKTRDNPNQGRVYGVNGVAPCLNSFAGGNRQPYIIEKITYSDVVKQPHKKIGDCDVE